MIIGTWKLKSCIGRSSSGKTFFPYGQNPDGQLIYTVEGRMAVNLMSSERRKFESEDLAVVTSEEKALAFESFDAYSGSYLVDDKLGTVTHNIETARVPNWINRSHKRFFEIFDGTLRLTTEPFEMSGEKWTVEVVWQRAGI